jgi:LPS O-antigen subunit length determinant protein (WzzB/FepE family)
MKQNNRFSENAEIDLLIILREIWKNKILIILISLVFITIGYLYGVFKSDAYRTEIKIRNLPEFSDLTFFSNGLKEITRLDSSNIYDPDLTKNLTKSFNEEFKLNLLSTDNLNEFMEQNNEIEEFKSYLRNKNIDFKKYFLGRFVNVNNRFDNSNLYSLNFEKPLQGDKFLNDYVVYTFKKTEKEFKEKMIKNVISMIQLNKNNLKDAKEIISANSIYQFKDDIKNTQENKFDPAYYNYAKQVSANILSQENFLILVKNFKFEHNPILDKASYPYSILPSKIISIFISFIIGLILSIFIIFLKFKFRNKVT